VDVIEAEAPGQKKAAPVTDEVFVRRIYLDIAGRIPTLKETTDFLADKSSLTSAPS
jgi:hypothetical protein